MGLIDDVFGGDDDPEEGPENDNSGSSDDGGFLDDVGDTVDDVADDVGEAVGDVADGAQDAVDDISEGAGDVADEVSEGDLGGAVDEAGDTVSDVGDTVSDTVEDVASGDADTGSDPDPSPEPSSDPEPTNDPAPDPAESDSGGGGDGSSTPSVTDQLLDQGQDDLPDTQEEVDQAQEFRDQNPLISAANPEMGNFLNTREENLEVRDQLDQQIDRLQEAPEEARIRFGEGQDAETLNRTEALDRLRDQRQDVSQTLNQNERRVRNPPEPIEPVMSRGDFNRLQKFGTTDTVKEAAEDLSLDDVADRGIGFDIPFVGDKGEEDFRLTGTPAQAALGLKTTFASPRSFSLVGAVGDNIPGVPGDKTVEDVLTREAVEEYRSDVEGEGIVEDATETVSSAPGLLLGSGAIGAGAKAGTTALAARGGRAAQAAKAIEVGGGAAGAAYTGLEAKESADKFQEGQGAEAISNLARLGTEEFGFAKGFRRAGRAFAPEVDGSVRLDEFSQVRSTGDNDFVGQGEFTGETNIQQNRWAEFLGIGESGTAEVRGQFNVRGGDGTSEARGTMELELPSGRTRTKDFESLSIETSQGETPGGDEVRFSNDIFRTFEEGPLFRNTRTEEGTTKSIKEGETPLSETFVERGGVSIRDTDAEGRIIERSSFSRDSEGLETFGDSRTVVREAPSETGGGAGGSAGGSGQTGMRVSGVRDGEFVSTDLAGQEFVDMARQPPSSTRTDLGQFGSAGGSGAQGRMADSEFLQDFQREQQAFEETESTERFEIQRGETREELVDPVDPGPGAEVVEGPGGLGQEEVVNDPFEVGRTGPNLGQDRDQINRPFQEERPEEAQRQRPEEIQEQAPVEELQPVEEINPVQEEKIMQDRDLLFEQTQRQQFERDPFTGRAEGPRRPPVPFGGDIDFPELGGEFGEFEEPGGGRGQDPEFRPSLGAVIFGIEGEAPADDEVLTGTEVRPIPEDREEEFETFLDRNPLF